jgi:predicted PurR-regulated permease PerM
MDEQGPVARFVSRSGMALGLGAVAAGVIILFGLRFTAPLLAPLFLAFMTAVILMPVVRYLERRGLATGAAVVGVLVIVVLGGGLFVFLVYVQLVALGEKLPEYGRLLTERLTAAGAAFSGNTSVHQALEASATQSSKALIQAAAQTIAALLSSTVSLIFFLFILCLMLASAHSFSRQVKRVAAPDSQLHAQVAEFCRQVQIQGGIRTLSNLLTAGAFTLEYVIFHVDFAFLWGMLAFVLGYIPYIGLIIAAVPAIILTFILHGIGLAVVVLLVAVILNAIMDNAVTPRFVSERSQMPMIIASLSFFFWTWLMGPLGAVFAIPATLLLRAVLDGRRETRALGQLMTTEADGVDPPPQEVGTSSGVHTP